MTMNKRIGYIKEKIQTYLRIIQFFIDKISFASWSFEDYITEEMYSIKVLTDV